MSEYEYWLDKKNAYENNLKNGIGNKETLKYFIYKINKKLERISKKYNNYVTKKIVNINNYKLEIYFT